MFKSVRNFIAIVLVLASVSANAATYNVDETFSGSFTRNWDNNFLAVHTLSFASLISGDASLFSSSATSSVTGQWGPDLPLVFCTSGCNFTETIKNGDTFFGSINMSSFDQVSVTRFNYSGTFTIEGGTGLFAGASGAGTFTGTDNFVLDSVANHLGTTGTTTQRSTFSITTVSAVPEPETYAMLLAGLGLFGFIARKNKTA